ncbi:MAG TPA: YciI family protein [Longimicrobiaceae bacterium]|nr:YciI family protein [Longimicrobiaceae bacterium]
MRCDDIQPALIDREVEGIPLPAEVAAHVRMCPRCAGEAEALGALWIDLKAAVTTAPGEGAVDAMISLARTEMNRLARRARARRRAPLVAGIALAALTGGLTGYTIGRGPADRAPTAATTPSAPGRGQFLLLLHESPRSSPAPSEAAMATIVEEYREWAERLETRGQLVAAEKLSDDGGRWLGTTPAPTGGDVVSGFFVVRAKDYEEALRIARESPHLKYGSRIEVRAIET